MIKIWSISPLDSTNSSFSKVLENKCRFKKTSEIKFFDLDWSKWTTYCKHILGKRDRCFLKKIMNFTMTAARTTSINLIKSYFQCTSARVKEFGDFFEVMLHLLQECWMWRKIRLTTNVSFWTCSVNIYFLVWPSWPRIKQNWKQ